MSPNVKSVCVPTGFGFPQSFRPSTIRLYALQGEEDSGPFPHTSDLYCVHIVAMLSGNYAGNISRERYL